jgi:ribonuclease T2
MARLRRLVPLDPAMRHALFGFVLALAACALSRPALADGIPGSFDFYVLSLSWSPTYCLITDRPDRRQCGDRSYGFVVHGLWPQYEAGYPDYCEGSAYERPPNEVVDSVLDIMPSHGLVHHQWRKHGTCAGLPHPDYFDLVREAFEVIEIPSEFAGGSASLDPTAVERAFLSANPDLTPGGIAVTCKRGALSEVRICLTKDLDFRECDEVDRDSCRMGRISVPAIR